MRSGLWRCSWAQVCAVLNTDLFLDFLPEVAPWRFLHLRSCWELANECGAIEKWCNGGGSVDCGVASSEDSRNDMSWRRRAVEGGPSKRIQHRQDGPDL